MTTQTQVSQTAMY